MALKVGQRFIRINEDEVRKALHLLEEDVPIPYIDSNERIVEASVQLQPAGPHIVVFTVERQDDPAKD